MCIDEYGVKPTSCGCNRSMYASGTVSVEYVHTINEPCIICKSIKYTNTVIPYGSQCGGKYICGDCFALYFDSILESLSSNKICPICGQPERSHEFVSQCPDTQPNNTVGAD